MATGNVNDFVPATGDYETDLAQLREALGKETIPTPERDYYPARDTGDGFNPGGGTSPLRWVSSRVEAETTTPEVPVVETITPESAGSFLDDDDDDDYADLSDDDDDHDTEAGPEAFEPPTIAEPASVDASPSPVESLTAAKAAALSSLTEATKNLKDAGGRHDQLDNLPALGERVAMLQRQFSDADYELQLAVHEALVPDLKTPSEVEAKIAELQRWKEDKAYEAEQLDKAGRPLRAADLRKEIEAQASVDRFAELTVGLKYRQSQALADSTIEARALKAVQESFRTDEESIRREITAKHGKARGDKAASLFRLKIENREPSDGREDLYTIRLNEARERARADFDKSLRDRHSRAGASYHR
jgi:hypothetical protein